MNTGLINGFILNGPTKRGSNAVLSGGTTAVAVFSAILTTGVFLTGGLSSNVLESGQITNTLQGGMSSGTSLSAGWFITTVLRDGIKVDPLLSSRLNQAPSLKYGAYSAGDVGGQLIASPRLQSPSNVGSLASLGGMLTADTALNGGVPTSAFVGGGLRGGIVLMNGGLPVTAKVGGSNRDMGSFSMRDGISKTASIGGEQLITGRFSGGFITSTEVGKELDIEAILTDGMIQVGVVGSPPMQLSPRLNSGMGAYDVLGGKIILSPNSNGGVGKSSSFSSNQIITAMLQGSTSSTVTLGSKPMRAAQTLQGGLASNALFGSGYIVNDRLPGGLASDAVLGSKYHIPANLQGGLGVNSIVGSTLRVDSMLYSGVQSTTALAGVLRTQVLLKDGFSVTDELGGGIRTAIFLKDGFYSVAMTDGDLLQGFLDPLINSRWLEIFSATEKLEIFTPSEDI